MFAGDDADSNLELLLEADVDVMMLKQKKEQLRLILAPTDLHKANVALGCESGIEEFQVTDRNDSLSQNGTLW